jgi:hypothetical protein
MEQAISLKDERLHSVHTCHYWHFREKRRNPGSHRSAANALLDYGQEGSLFLQELSAAVVELMNRKLHRIQIDVQYGKATLRMLSGSRPRDSMVGMFRLNNLARIKTVYVSREDQMYACLK